MASTGISTAAVHRMPADLRKALTSSGAVRAAWEDRTPLARNEWICWIESAKRAETRSHRIERTRSELLAGKRRPCCWAGCMHR
ncbi:YdeI/OmpD-associated family protein [Candidatus Uhrbacteria bacterium]|nr:YdeI/OmpD-associated family protein [Candidatus Uhrbacteria bacterium]